MFWFFFRLFSCSDCNEREREREFDPFFQGELGGGGERAVEEEEEREEREKKGKSTKASLPLLLDSQLPSSPFFYHPITFLNFKNN